LPNIFSFAFMNNPAQVITEPDYPRMRGQIP
jgi:hypothetical protein